MPICLAFCTLPKQWEVSKCHTRHFHHHCVSCNHQMLGRKMVHSDPQHRTHPLTFKAGLFPIPWLMCSCKVKCNLRMCLFTYADFCSTATLQRRIHKLIRNVYVESALLALYNLTQIDGLLSGYAISCQRHCHGTQHLCIRGWRVCSFFLPWEETDSQ